MAVSLITALLQNPATTFWISFIIAAILASDGETTRLPIGKSNLPLAGIIVTAGALVFFVGSGFSITANIASAIISAVIVGGLLAWINMK